MGMASFPVVVLDIDVPHVLAVDAERHAKIPRQPHAPLAASRAFERMQSPTGKPCDLLDMSRLFDGVKDILQLRHKIGANAATITGLIEAFESLVTKACYSHV